MEEASDKLTPKQRMFIESYLGAARWNATRAATIAGYKHPAVQGCQLLRLLKIRAAVDERLREAAMSADEVLGLLSDQARSSIEDLTDEDGRVDFALARKRGKLHLIKEYTVEVELTGEDTPPIERTKVKMCDSLAALTLLARHHQLLTDRHIVSGPDGRPVEVQLNWNDPRIRADSDL